MKLFNIFIGVFTLLSISIVNGQSKAEEAQKFGASFEVAEQIGSDSEVYKKLQANDTLTTQLKGKITEVCQAKGCWMKVDLTDGQEVFVRFKDYGFFVPTDAAESQVLLNGKAFLEEMSVADQKHYAKDKGASDAELAQITQPKRTYRFEADGVIIEK